MEIEEIYILGLGPLIQNKHPISTLKSEVLACYAKKILQESTEFFIRVLTFTCYEMNVVLFLKLIKLLQ